MCIRDRVEIAEVEFVLEEELRDGAGGSGIDFGLEHVDVGLERRTVGMPLRIGRHRDLEIGGNALDAADKIGGIKRIAPDFEISVSAYPERHPDSPTLEADIDMLKAKVDAGASRAITQFFFENELYFRYLD